MFCLVKIEGTLAEIRDLFVDSAISEVKVQAKKAGGKVVRTVAKRTKSAWQRYMGQKKNQIKFKSGARKGRLDLTKMARAYKRTRK